MRRLVVGTAVMAACSTAYALAGDLDGHRLRLAAVMVGWWLVAVVVVRWVRAAPHPRRRSRVGGCSSSCSSRPWWPAARPAQPTALELGRLPLRLGRAGPAVRHLPLPLRAARRPAGRVARPRALPGARTRRPLRLPHPAAADRPRRAAGPVVQRRPHQDQPPAGAHGLPAGRPGVVHRGGPADAVVLGHPRPPARVGAPGSRCGGGTGGPAPALRRDPWAALWWAWCPTVLAEAGNGAHVDVLAAAFVVAALAAAARRQ